jgi:methyl-accepting chemotaxis protein
VQKRTIYVVDESFQIKYSLLLALTGLLVSALVGMVIYNYNMAHDNVLLMSGLDQSQDMVNFFQSQHKILIVKLVTLCAIITMFLFLAGLIITHRITGPLFSIKKAMKQISESGDLGLRVSLRKNDELKSFADEFNNMMEKLGDRYVASDTKTKG